MGLASQGCLRPVIVRTTLARPRTQKYLKNCPLPPKKVLNALSDVSFLGLLLLVAQGWSITKEEVTSKVAFILLYGSYALVYLAVFVYQVSLIDPASVKSQYQVNFPSLIHLSLFWIFLSENKTKTFYFCWFALLVCKSIPGIILLTLKCLAFLYFLYNLRMTYHEESNLSKRGFYRKFGLFFAFWFLVFPVLVGIIAGVDSTIRDKTVVALTKTVSALSMTAMAYLLWPSRTYKYFQLQPFGSVVNNDVHSEALPYGSI